MAQNSILQVGICGENGLMRNIGQEYTLDGECNENATSIHRFQSLVTTALSKQAQSSSHENALMLAKDQMQRQSVQSNIERSQFRHQLQTRLAFNKTRDQVGAVKGGDDSSATALATALATSSVKKKGAELEQKEKSELVIVAPTMPPPLRLYSNSDSEDVPTHRRYRYFDFSTCWPALAKLWLSPENAAALSNAVDMWISMEAPLGEDWRRGSPLWQLTGSDCRPNYTVKKVHHWLHQRDNRRFANGYFRDAGLEQPVSLDELKDYFARCKYPMRERVLARHRHELLYSTATGCEISRGNSAEETTAGSDTDEEEGVNPNDAAAVESWLAKRESMAVHQANAHGASVTTETRHVDGNTLPGPDVLLAPHTTTSDVSISSSEDRVLSPQDMLINLDKHYLAPVTKLLVLKLCPDISDNEVLLVPDSMGKEAPVCANDGIVFDLHAYLSACGTDATHVDASKTCCQWPPDESLSKSFAMLWSHLPE